MQRQHLCVPCETFAFFAFKNAGYENDEKRINFKKLISVFALAPTLTRPRQSVTLTNDAHILDWVFIFILIRSFT